MKDFLKEVFLVILRKKEKMNLFSSIFGKRKEKLKEAEKKFKEMDKKEKKQFLSNDLIDRMIRVEQRVFHSFGNHVPYKKTSYYKNLTKKEKESYDKFLKRRERTKKLFLFVLFLSSLILVFLGSKITGRAVEDTIGEATVSLISVSLIIIFLTLLFLLFISFIIKKSRKRKLEKHFDILDGVGLIRYTKEIGKSNDSKK